MEYSSKKDFFLKFRALYDEKNKFIDYILVDGSENFQNVINYKSDPLLGKRISEIVLENQNDILGLENFYYNMIPKTSRRFEVYIQESEIWYIVNIFSDEKDYLLLFYTDITRYKNSNKNQPNKYIRDFEETRKQYL